MKNLKGKSQTILVGIDGCGGSGKSTLAGRIASLNQSITIIHMDDFYLPKIIRESKEKTIDGDFDYLRLIKQVLNPLSNNQDAYYQKYDWNLDQLNGWHKVNIGGIVIIEGVYSLRKELIDYYDYKIFVNCPKEIRLKRGLERDGEEARDIWVKNWMVKEDHYLHSYKPDERADLIIDGTN